jgi:hypothetical protein
VANLRNQLQPPKLSEVCRPPRIDRSTAWGYVLSNLVLPGLGTLAARRRLAGTLQLVVSQAGFVLMVIWTISFVRAWMQQGNLPDDPGPHFGVGLLGMALFLLAWIWSLASSAGILQDSRKSGL